MYQTHKIDRDDLCRFVAKALNSFEEQYRRPPELLLVGVDDFREIQRLEIHGSYVSLSADVRQSELRRDGGTHVFIFGVQVVVVPHMKGIVPITREMLHNIG